MEYIAMSHWKAILAVSVLLLTGCAGGSLPQAFGVANSSPEFQSVDLSLVLGGFDEARGGQGSLQDPAVAKLKAAIASGFPGMQFKFAGKLTPTFLANVNVVLLGVIKSPTSGITPLSKPEQSALANFVNSGGVAVIFTDNDTFDGTAVRQNNSLLAPFGLRATGTLNGSQVAKFVGSNNPVQTGPFGTAQQLDTFYPGWFSRLGASTKLAAFVVNNKPALAYLPAQGSHGAAVFFADSSLLLDSTRTSNDLTAILNALALAP